MAYDNTFPANDSFLADFPEGYREQIKSIIQDAIVNAGMVNNLLVGNANGNIPVSNGAECANLNAAKLNGKSAGEFAPKEHGHKVATESSDGYMSNVMCKKLNGVATGAEVNQNAFANVKVGNITVQADAKQDTLELVAGTNIALTPDATNDRVTVAVNGKVASAANADNATSATQLKNARLIGSASFNGTANITLAQMRAVGFYETTIPPTANWNSYITPGFYPIGQEQPLSATYNQPTNAYPYGCLVVFKSGIGLAQTYYSHGGSEIWHRGGFNGGGWQPWCCLFRNGVATTATTAVVAATQATTDSSTKIATTAFVNNRLLASINKNAADAATTYPFGISAHMAYNAGYPCAYGNTFTIRGNNNGTSQFLIEWSGTTGGTGRVFFRNARDSAPGTWSPWLELARVSSPNFTGVPTAPTPAVTDNSTKIATTAFVLSLINTLKSNGTLGVTTGQSLAGNGWVKFSNKFIIQWGSARTYADNAYPLAFPTAALRVVIGGSIAYNLIDRTKFHLDDPNVSDGWKPPTREYVAFGY